MVLKSVILKVKIIEILTIKSNVVSVHFKLYCYFWMATFTVSFLAKQNNPMLETVNMYSMLFKSLLRSVPYALVRENHPHMSSTLSIDVNAANPSGFLQNPPYHYIFLCDFQSHI